MIIRWEASANMNMTSNLVTYNRKFPSAVLKFADMSSIFMDYFQIYFFNRLQTCFTMYLHWRNFVGI